MSKIHQFPGGEKRPEPPRIVPVIEPAMAPEIFAGEMPFVDVHGVFARLCFAAPSRVFEDHPSAEEQRIVVAKLIVPTGELRAMAQRLLDAAQAADGGAAPAASGEAPEPPAVNEAAVSTIRPTGP